MPIVAIDLSEDEAARRATYQHAGRFEFAQRTFLDARPSGQPSGQFRYTLNKDGSLSKRGGDALPSAEFTALLTQVEVNLRHLGEALAHWKKYAAVRDSQYLPGLYNRLGYVDITALTEKVADDLTLARSWKPGTLKDDGKRGGNERVFRK